MLTLAFKSAGNVTSMFPFNELKAMAFCGSTFVNVAFKCPFKACATALPETLFSVTEPFTSSTSNSPSTPVTTMSPSFTALTCSEVCTGTEIVISIACMYESVLMFTSLFSSSTESPVVSGIASRFGPPSRELSRLRARASTTTSLPSYAFTVIPPLIRLTFIRAGREGSLSVTGIRSPPVCVWPCPNAFSAPVPNITTAIAANANRAEIDENCFMCLFMVFQYPNVSIQIFHLDLRAAGMDTRSRVPVRAKNHFAAVVFLLHSLRRQRRDRKIAVNPPVKSLESKISRKVVRELQLDIPIHRFEPRRFARILPERHLHRTIHRARRPRSRDIVHLYVAVHIANQKAAVDIAHRNPPLI